MKNKINTFRKNIYEYEINATSTNANSIFARETENASEIDCT